jgi:hypothetical protein
MYVLILRMASGRGAEWEVGSADSLVFRFLPAVNATTRVPAAIFFGIRAWRLHRKSWVIPAILTPLVYVDSPHKLPDDRVLDK